MLLLINSYVYKLFDNLMVMTNTMAINYIILHFFNKVLFNQRRYTLLYVILICAIKL